MGKEGLNFYSELNLYGLNNPGIPFLAKGEKPVLSDLATKKLTGKTGTVEKNRFSDRPISNLVFHQSASGDWRNGSWIMDIEGFDSGAFDLLLQPQATLVRFLGINEELAQVSDCRQMVEIGFNVGGGEIVFKRILLPGKYALSGDWPETGLVYQGTQMPDVFVEAWDKLKVGDYDWDWDRRVREQLEGNSRGMNKRIIYQMINGEKWVEWNGVKMWAGLLSDRRDIGRFLAEESALATLKPGEFMVAKYSHGSGGVISAATAQQRKTEKPQIVGDIQMMGKNGEVYQAAVEEGADQIDALINGLVDQLHCDHNLSAPETIMPLGPWLASLPVLPLATYPAKFLLRNEIPIGLKPEALPLTVDTGVTESVVSVAPPIFDLTPDIYSWAANDVEFIDFDLGFDVEDNSDNSVAVFDWPEPDNGPDGDDGGWDSGFVWPPEPIPGGGLGIMPTRSLLVGKLIEAEKQQLKVTVVEDRCCFPKKRILEKAGTATIVFESAAQKKSTREIQTAGGEKGKVETETKVEVEVEEKEPIKTAGNDKKIVFSVDNHQTAALKISRVSIKLRDNAKEAEIIPTGTIPIYKIKWPKMKPAEIPEYLWQWSAAGQDQIIDWPWFLVTMFYALLNTKVLLNEKIS